MNKTIRVSELTGAALDWAVAKCENHPNISGMHPDGGVRIISGQRFSPSSNWQDGGPIIDMMPGLLLKQWIDSPPASKCEAGLHNYDGNWIEFGPTLLIAAMRCYVASKLGDEIEVPQELI